MAIYAAVLVVFARLARRRRAKVTAEVIADFDRRFAPDTTGESDPTESNAVASSMG